MSQKISLHVGGKTYSVDVDDSFAPFLKHQMSKDFNVDGNNDLKKLLQAYVRKNYELYTQELEVGKIMKKLNDLG
jgi:predicted HD phosphohydrolase